MPYGSYEINHPLKLVLSLAISEDLISPLGAENKGLITAGLDAVVDLYIS